MRLKRKRALKEFYDETLQKFPDNVLWYNRAAAFALEENDLGRAERLYEQAWQKSKKDGKGDANAFGGYLQALLSGGKLNQVFTVAQECVEGDFAPIAFCKMAEAKLRMADKAAAVQYCRKALRKAGENETFAGWVLGRMYSLLGGDEVLRACEERLEANPDSLAANYAMFHVVRINGEYNKAIGYVDKCIEIVGPDDQRRFGYVSQKAMVLQLAFEKTSDNAYIQTAIAEYESLVAKVSNRVSGAPVLNNFAYMLAENDERLVEALEYAKRAHEVKPNDPSFLDTYAFVLYKNGRFSEAAEFMLAALQQYEQSSIVPSPYAYEHLGMIKEKLGAVAEAIGNYRKALEVGGGELPEGARQRINTAIERLSQESETKT